MRLVVDASIAVKWLVEEEHSAEAKRLITGPFELFAPRLLASDFADALWPKGHPGRSRLDRIVRVRGKVA